MTPRNPLLGPRQFRTAAAALASPRSKGTRTDTCVHAAASPLSLDTLPKACMLDISILCACHSHLPVQIWHAQITMPALYGCHVETMVPPYMHASSHLLGCHVNCDLVGLNLLITVNICKYILW